MKILHYQHKIIGGYRLEEWYVLYKNEVLCRRKREFLNRTQWSVIEFFAESMIVLNGYQSELTKYTTEELEIEFEKSNRQKKLERIMK